MPLTECRRSDPLIYHEQGRGEVLHRSSVKIEREREWKRGTAGDAKTGRERENEIKKGEKNSHIEKQRAKGDNAEI